MIVAIGKSTFQVEYDILDKVQAKLRDAGFREIPSWFLYRDSEWVFVLPDHSSKETQYTISVKSNELNKYHDTLCRFDEVDLIVYSFLKIGFIKGYHKSYVGHRSSVRIHGTRTNNDNQRYYLEIKGFNHKKARSILEELGVDYRFIER